MNGFGLEDPERHRQSERERRCGRRSDAEADGYVGVDSLPEQVVSRD